MGSIGIFGMHAMPWSMSVPELSAPLTEEQVSHLMASYRRLPAFGDALGALPRLSLLGTKYMPFSNGLAQRCGCAASPYAGIDHFFLDIVSADEIRTFKPDPAPIDTSAGDRIHGGALLVKQPRSDVL